MSVSRSGLDIIQNLFPQLSGEQVDQLTALEKLYIEWNSQVNVISRKDMDEFYTHHVLHSLLLGHLYHLDGSSVIDVGTGGGFPGVPLAILFPEGQFLLVDSIAKKLKVVSDVAERIGLQNVAVRHTRMEDIEESYDYLTGRAVKAFDQLYAWGQHLVNWEKGAKKSGMLYLKGGDFSNELQKLPRATQVHALDSIVPDIAFFETKSLVHIYQDKS